MALSRDCATFAGDASAKPPRDYPSDALGGDLYWSAGVNLTTPVPLPGLWYRNALKLHGFVNAGYLGNHTERTGSHPQGRGRTRWGTG